MDFGRLRAVVLAGVLAALALPVSASAETLMVDDPDDLPDAVAGDGVCDAAGSDGCTLRAAVETAADASFPDGDLILLPFDVELGGTELAASDNGALTIRGTGPGHKAIDGDGSSRIINTATITLTLEHVVLRNGVAEDASDFRGGAVRFGADDSSDVLHLDDAMVEGSASIPTGAVANTQAEGGGVYVTGTEPTLRLTDAEVVGNTAGDASYSGRGGGISVGSAFAPTVIVTSSEISQNIAVGGPPGAEGGGLAVTNFAPTAPFGSVTLTNSTVSMNRAGGDATFTTGLGGGVYLDGGSTNAPDLSLIGTTAIEDNTAGGGSGDALGEGGGVMVDDAGGTVLLNGAGFQGNSAGGADSFADGEGIGRGGGLYSRSSVTAMDATFNGNRAGVADPAEVDPGVTGEGGAMLVAGSAALSVVDSLFQQNRSGTETGTNPDGGAVLNRSPAPMSITGSSFVLNESRGAGGAINRFRDTTLGDPDTITNSRFVQNTSRGNGGAMHSNSKRPLTISGAEFSLNTTTGEAAGFGGALSLASFDNLPVLTGKPLVTIRNATVAQNTAAGAGGEGGGITLGASNIGQRAPDALLDHVTLAGNTAGDDPGEGLGGNLRIEEDNFEFPEVDVRASIVSDGAALNDPNCAFVDLPGDVDTDPDDLNYDSLGGNVESEEDCEFDGPGDLVDTDPLLDSLADNGDVGQSGRTMALPAGSPAIDNVPAALCAGVTTDQRGYPRPSVTGADCDSGAYERFVCNGVTLDGPGAFPGCLPPQESTPDPVTQPTSKPKAKKKCKKKKGKKKKKKGKGKGASAAAKKKKKKCKKKKKKKKKK